jgi:hypothetical protein
LIDYLDGSFLFIASYRLQPTLILLIGVDVWVVKESHHFPSLLL